MRRGMRSASVSAIVIVVVLGLLVVGNVLASRSTQAWDLTSAGNNTLTPQSVLAATRLKSDLQLIGLFRPSSPGAQAETESLIALYVAQSPHLKYRREDVGTDLTDVKHYAVTLDNTVVLDYNGKTQLLVPGSQTEQHFTSAILTLESDRVPAVCWAGGVGGRSLTDTNKGMGYSAVADLLTKNNFATRDLLINEASSIPTDCDVVAVVGPTDLPKDATVKALVAYLASGGRLFIACNPWDDPAVTAAWDSALKPYGPSFSGGLIIETDASRYVEGNPTIAEVPSYGSSPITADVTGLGSFFPQATAITGAPAKTMTGVPLAVTSAGSYSVQRPRPVQNLARQPGDTAGPFTVMQTVESAGAGTRTRIVMVGTAAFAENGSMPPYSVDANFQLTLGSFQWLAGEDSLIAFAPKPGRYLPLALTQDDQSILIFITAVLMPGIVVIGGIVVWSRRRVFP